jgi:hypothetical protein
VPAGNSAYLRSRLGPAEGALNSQSAAALPIGSNAFPGCSCWACVARPQRRLTDAHKPSF